MKKILLLILLAQVSSAHALEIPKDTKIKIEFLSEETNEINKPLNIIVKKDVKVKNEDGKKINLTHYKTKRKTARKAAKVAKTATLFTPIGAAAKLAQVGVTRKTNKYNLPKKMFVEEALEI